MNSSSSNVNPMVPIEDNMKSEEIGLPKSTLWNFIKDELTQNKVKADRSIYQLIDKISIRYVNYISSLGSQICTKNGKKTLNIEHILEALKVMNFDNHIKLLTKELINLEKSGIKEEEEKEGKESKYEDHTFVKQLINKNKKKTGKRKRQFETEEEKEEIAREQKELFEMARKEQMSQELLKYSQQNLSSIVNTQMNQNTINNVPNIPQPTYNTNENIANNLTANGDNDDIEKEIFKNNNNNEEEVDFDGN